MSPQSQSFTLAVLTCVIAAALSLAVLPCHGQGDIGVTSEQTSSPSTAPPANGTPAVEQALIPESVLATQMVEAFKLGQPQDEAKAEAVLSGLGIEPRNGWISDYPVTPSVIGDLEKGVAAAAEQGKISLPKDQAVKVFGEIKTRLGLEVKPAANAQPAPAANPGNATIYSYTDKKGVIHYTDQYQSIPDEFRQNAKIIAQPRQPEISGSAPPSEPKVPRFEDNPNPQIINNYYYEQGPPVVTYYAPPDPYYYLYSWISYPFWYTGLYYPGYFVLNNFHRRVYFDRRPYTVTHHYGPPPMPIARTPAPVNPIAPIPHTITRPTLSPGFASPKAQAGAEAIVSLNPGHVPLPQKNYAPTMASPIRPYSSNGIYRGYGNYPNYGNHRPPMTQGQIRPLPYNGGGNFHPPQSPQIYQRPYAPTTPNFSGMTGFPQHQGFGAPHPHNGGLSGGFHAGGTLGGRPSAGPMGGFQGGGNFGGSGGPYSGGGRR